jgi:hypothetical protein
VGRLASRASHQTLASASEQGRPQSSHGKVVWGQSTRSDTDRYVRGQPPGSHAGFGGQGHERRGREGDPKVSEEKPEGAETWEGIEEPVELITLSVASNRCSDQDPEGDAAGTGAVEATRR